MLMIEKKMPVSVKNGGLRARPLRRSGRSGRSRAVDVAPHQGGDDAGDGVRHEDGEPGELGQPHHAAVQGEGEKGQDQHERHLDQQEQPHPADTGEEAGIGQSPQVVLGADERGAADQLGLEEAEVAGVDQGDHDHGQEQTMNGRMSTYAAPICRRRDSVSRWPGRAERGRGVPRPGAGHGGGHGCPFGRGGARPGVPAARDVRRP